jgi:hypothetical protein
MVLSRKNVVLQHEYPRAFVCHREAKGRVAGIIAYCERRGESENPRHLWTSPIGSPCARGTPRLLVDGHILVGPTTVTEIGGCEHMIHMKPANDLMRR